MVCTRRQEQCEERLVECKMLLQVTKWYAMYGIDVIHGYEQRPKANIQQAKGVEYYMYVMESVVQQTTERGAG